MHFDPSWVIVLITAGGVLISTGVTIGRLNSLIELVRLLRTDLTACFKRIDKLEVDVAYMQGSRERQK